MDEKRIDTASEPVDHQDDEEFMDTGVLHERKKKDDEEGEKADE
jgi:hypothetical protein